MYRFFIRSYIPILEFTTLRSGFSIVLIYLQVLLLLWVWSEASLRNFGIMGQKDPRLGIILEKLEVLGPFKMKLCKIMSFLSVVRRAVVIMARASSYNCNIFCLYCQPLMYLRGFYFYNLIRLQAQGIWFKLSFT